MKPAIIVVDMLEGNYGKERNGTKEEEKIVPGMRDFLKKCRALSIPVIFACDSFMEKDFIFKGRMKPHAIRGTSGTKPLSDLEPEESDIILESADLAPSSKQPGSNIEDPQYRYWRCLRY
jgi:nicotinamidase-related amidase